MSAEPLSAGAFLASLPVRMALIAGFVLAVALLAERMGPFLGGMVASLPIYTGPVYVVLAIEHDVAFLERATIGSIAICGATAVFVLTYCVLARACGVLTSLCGALAAWGVCVAIIQSGEWSVVEALLFVTPIYAVSVPLARGFTRGTAVAVARRGPWDLPLRAGLVAGLAGLVIWSGGRVPPQLTGILSVVPIILTSIILVLHPRVGGPATAALLAHTLGGLVGMVVAFVVVHMLLAPYGAAAALSTGLAISIGWNLMLILARRLARPRAPAPARR